MLIVIVRGVQDVPKKSDFLKPLKFQRFKKSLFWDTLCNNSIMSMILLGQWSWCPSPPAWGRPFYSALLPAPARWFSHLILIIMSMTPDLHNWWHLTRAFIFGEIDCFAQIGLYAGTACLGFFISWQVLIWNHPLVNLSLNQISHFFRLFQIVVRRLLLLGGEEVQHNRKGENIFIGTATTIVLEVS